MWQALPRRYRRHCWYFTDLIPVYVGVLLRWHHRCSPSIIEVINCPLRQRYGVLVRKYCSFSKSIRMLEARIKILIDSHNATLN